MTSSVSVPSKGEAGFTLIELLVVILIIGILAAIGIPALLSQRDKAKNSAAKSAVRTALTAAKTIYTEDDNFAALTPAALDRVEPTLYVGAPAIPADTTGPGDTAEPKNIWIADAAGSTSAAKTEEVVLCSVSKGNSIACVYDNEDTGNLKFAEFVEGKNSTGNPTLSDVNGSAAQVVGAAGPPVVVAAGGVARAEVITGDAF